MLNIPAGWKLAPIEPTEAMIVCGFESRPDPVFSKPEEWEAFDAMTGCQQAAHKARLCYAAMLAAAPTPPASAQDDAKDERQAQPIKLVHLAVAEDGGIRFMTGRKLPDGVESCELYAMPDYGRAPAELFCAPAAGDARDAARYRWLRDPQHDVALVLDKRTGYVPGDESIPGVGGYHTYEYRAGEELDAAIDAAIAAQQGKGGNDA